jgi:hypothetical protein
MMTGMIVPNYLTEVQSVKLTTKSTKPRSLCEHVNQREKQDSQHYRLMLPISEEVLIHFFT